MIRWTAIVTAAALTVWVSPVLACDTGPWLIKFPYGGRSPVSESTEAILALNEMRRQGDTIRFILYNEGASSPILWKARVASLRAILRNAKIRDSDVEMVSVQSRRGMVAGDWIGRSTQMTAKLVAGCHS